MTARSTDPKSRARQAKREDTTPKAKTTGIGAKRPMEARARGIDTSTYEGAELIDPNKPLTEKQKLFVKFWAEGETIPCASARAGYADGATFAYRLVRMPNVLALYNQYKAKYEEAGQMSRQKVMEMLTESYDMAKMMAEPSSMVAAAREIGKMCGYYAPVETKVKVDVTGNIVHQRLNTMSDAELLELITQRGGAAALLGAPAEGGTDDPGQ